MDELQESIDNVPVNEVPSSISKTEIPAISNISKNEISPVVSPENVPSNSNVLQEDEDIREGLKAEIMALSNPNSGFVDKDGFIITHKIEAANQNPEMGSANDLLKKISKS